jgi:hypothetical protein
MTLRSSHDEQKGVPAVEFTYAHAAGSITPVL